MKRAILLIVILLLPGCGPGQEPLPTPEPTAVISPTADTLPPSPTAAATAEPASITATAASEPPEPTAAATATNTPQPAPPAVTQPLQTDQVLLYAQDDALWRSNVDGMESAQLTEEGFLGWNHDEPFFVDTRPHLSPDGRYIAQLSAPETTRVLDLGTGQEFALPGSWEVAWSPDGRTVAFAPILGANGQALLLADAVTGAITERVEEQQLSGSGHTHNIAWSADGSQIAFDCCFTERDPYDGFSDGTIRVVDAASGEMATVMETAAGVASGPPDFCWKENGQLSLDPAPGMAHCSRNLPLETAAALSPNNLLAEWEASMDDQGEWASTRIFVTDQSDGRLLWEQTLPLRSFVVLSWSPDGRYLFADDQAADSPIWRISAGGQEISELLPGTTLLGVVPQWAEQPAVDATPQPDAANQSDGRSNGSVISADGQVVAFTSTGNLTGNAIGQQDTVFVRDVAQGTTELINETIDGRASEWPVYGLALSGSGQVVAYYSHDGRLVPGDELDCGAESDPISCEDLFIYERDTGLTERLPLGREDGLGKDYTVALSSDGRLVAYSYHVYDRVSGETSDIPTLDGQPPAGTAFAPQFASDGRFLAFISDAPNFVAGDDNEQFDVFVWDRETDQVERVSISSSGEQGNETSGALPFNEGIGDALAISADGRFVAFTSLATNLAEGTVNECDDYRGFARPCYNIYLHDRETGQTLLVTDSGDNDSTDPALSGDGRFLAFASLATNLSADPLPECGFPAIVNCGQIYLYDRESGQISLVSRSLSGAGGSSGSWQPDLSDDGRYITFVSLAADLAAADSNENSDIFRVDRRAGTTQRVSLKAPES